MAVDAVEDVHQPGGHRVGRHERRPASWPSSGSRHSCTMPVAVRPVAQPGLRHHVPAQGLGDDVRRDLAAGQGAVREVPEGPFPGDRLVDDADAVDLAEERRVGRRHDPAVHDQVASTALPASFTGPVGGSRSPARTGAPPGRSGCRRTGRSGRPALEDLVGALDEGAGAPGGDPDQKQLVGLRLLEVLVDLVRATTTAASVNGKTSITTRSSSGSQDSVMVPARNSSSIGCSSGSRVLEVERSDGRDDAALLAGGHHLVEQLVDPLGQGRHLLLLERDADQRGCRCGPGRRRCAPGRADGAGDEALRRVESVDDGAMRSTL